MVTYHICPGDFLPGLLHADTEHGDMESCPPHPQTVAMSSAVHQMNTAMMCGRVT